MGELAGERAGGEARGAALIGEIIAIASIVATAVFSVVTIRAQHRSSIERQRSQLHHQLGLEVYEKCADVLRAGADALGESASLVRRVLMSCESIVKNIPTSPLPTALEVSEDFYRSHAEMAKVLTFLEQYEILFLHFTEARRDFSEALRVLRESFHELFQVLVRVLPLDDPRAPGGRVGPLVPLNVQSLEALRAAVDRYLSAEGDVQGYVLDLSVEAQNELLGPIFNRTVPARNPGDPRVKVLRRSDALPITRPSGHW